MNFVFYIYGLNCPIENNIKYVGICQNIKSRLSTHLSSPLKSTKNWLENLKSNNKKPSLVVLQTIKTKSYNDRYLALACERIWINELNGLLNAEVLPVNSICDLWKKESNNLTKTAIEKFYKNLYK